jgi:hypothetical protein
MSEYLQLQIVTPEAAPVGKVLLVRSQGGWRFGIKDEVGNWRAKHNGRLRTPPTQCALMPEN